MYNVCKLLAIYIIDEILILAFRDILDKLEPT